MKPILLTLYFLVRLDGAILDVPLDRDEQGYYFFNATVLGNDTDVIRMRLQFASSTILSTRLMGSNVSIHTVVDDENIPLAEARTIYQGLSRTDGLLGIGPESWILDQYGDVDIYRSAENSFLRFGQSREDFETTACVPDSMLVVGIDVHPRVTTFRGRFDLVDPISGIDFNASSDVRYVVIGRFVGSGNFITLPLSVASHIHTLMVRNGARRAGIRSADDRSEIWSYTNCTSDILRRLPNLALYFYDSIEQSLTGTIHITAEEYLPRCEFYVDVGPNSSPSIMSIDLFQIPDINLRIGSGQIYLCDALTA